MKKKLSKHHVQKIEGSLYLEAGVGTGGLHGDREIGLGADGVIERESDLQVQADRGLQEKKFSQKTGDKTIFQQKYIFIKCWQLNF